MLAEQLEVDQIRLLLTELHVGHSSDPALLVAASFHDFNNQDERFSQVPTLQADLFRLASERGDDWTN